MPAAEPLTITDAALLLRTGQLTPSDLLEQCLVRIDRYEPHVKAWVYLDRERARQEAARLTDEIKKGHYRGPLHGIPVGIKDIIDVFDMPTGCGSKLWANSYARRDATCVERLRQAGALVLGKTVTTPYAYLDPPPTRNPWNLDRTPGGSSSGSAAAVACGMCLAALGTQTGGSLIRPASYCGLAGLLPGWSGLPTDGILPLAPLLDRVGVIARSAADLKSVYAAFDPPRSVLPATGVRLGFLTDSVFADHSNAVADIRSLLAATGWTYEDRPSGYDLAAVLNGHRTMMALGAAGFHKDRLARLPTDYPPRIAELIQEGESVGATDAALVREGMRRVRSDAERLGGSLFPDVGAFLLCAATEGPAPNLATTGSPRLQAVWSYFGLPTVSLPVGRAGDGLPLAVQLVGGAASEHDLLNVAAEAERAIGWQHELPPVPG